VLRAAAAPVVVGVVMALVLCLGGLWIAVGFGRSISKEA
jgi:hypothetical protein